MRVLDLFSGIGGFSLGFEWASPEFETVAFCEIDPYAQKVLKKHWPEVPIYDDITKIGKSDLEKVGPIDCITGGFPCQDISVAGKQKGMGEGTRSGLFFEIIRIVKLCRPRWVVLENVSAILSRPEWMGAVLGSFAGINYNVEGQTISAAQMGPDHTRKRAWFLAYPMRSKQSIEFKENFEKEKILRGDNEGYAPGRCFDLGRAWDVAWSEKTKGRQYNWPAEPEMGRMADGIPSQLDRLKCLGNAIVPQIAELIGRQIIKAEHIKDKP